MAGNLLGKSVDLNVAEQIKFKQQVFGAGYNDNSLQKTPKVNQYLNNRNAWIKLASGVSLGVPKPLEETIKNKESEEEAKKKLKGILKDEGFFGKLSESEIQSLMDDNLAKNFILFNGTQKLNKSAVFDEETSSQTTSAVYDKRSGVRQNNSNILKNFTNLYGGIGGSSKGLQPMPGIIDISVNCVNRGSIRKATVKIKAFNKLQFNILELLYLRLGYLMMLEWGWDKYIHNITNNEVDIRNVEGTIIDTYWFNGKNYNTGQIYNLIEDNRVRYKNNYDGFLGKVSNFEWQLNKDGTYDITLKLITIGSIIESLNMNQPIIGKTQNQLTKLLKVVRETTRENTASDDDIIADDKDFYEGDDVITSLGSDKFSYYLLSTIAAFPTNNKNYVYLPNLFKSLSVDNNSYKSKIPNNRRCYVRFGTLIEKMDKVCNFISKNGNNAIEKILLFDTDTRNNKCAYIKNLIPLKGDKVIFTFEFTKEFQNNNTLNIQSKFSKNLKTFADSYDLERNITYGRLMNIYFNVYYVAEAFKSHMNSKGEVPVFKFLETLCGAINESTGNITAIEPVIKDDRTVYFIDQNPIIGQDLVESSLQSNKNSEFQIYGFNSNGQSNFVTDFNFKTKITPDLSAQISIGATANGSDTKNIDAFPLRNWNKGLINKFEANLTSDGSNLNDSNVDEDTLYEKDAKKTFAEQIRNGGFSTSYSNEGGGWRSNGPNRGYTFKYENIVVRGIGGFGANRVNWSDDREDNASNDRLLSEGYQKWKEAKTKAYLIASKQTGQDIVSETYAASRNYLNYMVNAFGGSTGLTTLTRASIVQKYQAGGFLKKEQNIVETKELTISVRDSLWFELDENNDFQNRGKSAFKLYQQRLSQIKYEAAGEVSSTNGFIPLDLGLTFDGLSGIKIYNRIEVNTNFLPSSYPKALKFIATKVDHSVSGNMWETKINTLSVPVSNIIEKELVVAGNSEPATESEKPLEPEPIIKSTKPFKIIDNRTVKGVPVDPLSYGKEIDIFTFVSYFNSNAQPIFQNFILKLSSEYLGYTMTLNGVFRSFARSYELKYGVGGNENNASPGKSLHNYALAFDANITDPNGRTFKKKEREPWVKSGIPELAKKSGLVWGGSFSNYVDSVHFGYEVPREKLYANAYEKNKPVLEEYWKTKDTKLA